MTKTNANGLSQGKAQNGDVIFSNEGPGGLALGNHIIMDKISIFLSHRDLCHWYGSSRIFKDIIEQMDESTWRKRTQNLAKALNMDILPERTCKEMCPIFKMEVDSLVNRIVKNSSKNRYQFNLNNGLTLELLTAAARLAHYGQLGFDHLNLCHLDLSTVPGEHLCSLASSGRDTFRIQTVRGCDLIKIISSVKCNRLGISNQNLDTEATEAVVQAMDTRIEEAEIIDYKMFRFLRGNAELGEEDMKWMLDMEALTKYNGKGRCRVIILGCCAG